MGPRRVLVLGGTAEARELARLLHEDPRFSVLSSLAGRVANPRLPVGETRSGGFGGAAGLAEFLTDVDLLVDATHPFAATISRNAALAADAAGVSLLALVRPRWTAVDGDRWTRVPTVAAAAAELATRRPGAVLLTTGRQDTHEFAGLDDWRFVIRVVDAPSGPLPRRHELLRDRGRTPSNPSGSCSPATASMFSSPRTVGAIWSRRSWPQRASSASMW